MFYPKCADRPVLIAFAQVDAAGNAWVAGYTRSALDNNPPFGDWDIFLMKFDALGGHLWTRQRGGPGWDDVRALQVGWARRFSFELLFVEQDTKTFETYLPWRMLA